MWNYRMIHMTFLGIYFREMKLSVSHKNLYTNIHSFICNSPKLETTQMSVSSRMNKQTVILPYNEVLPGNRKMQVLIRVGNAAGSQKHRVKWKRPSPKHHTVWLHRREILEQTKRIYGDRRQNCGCCLGIYKYIYVCVCVCVCEYNFKIFTWVHWDLVAACGM